MPRVRRGVLTCLEWLRWTFTPRVRTAPVRWWRKIRRSYSQYGEDLILARYLSAGPGFYVDVGAFHPSTWNNTKRLYEQGWTGVNVEPIRSRWQLFIEERTRDLSLNCGVGTVPGSARFYEMVPAEYSTFNRDFADKMTSAGVAQLGDSYEVTVRTLADILELAEVPPRWDLLSLDVEGRDADVLRSNDWSRFRPRYVLVEIYHDDAVEKTLLAHNYKRVYANHANALFVDQDLES